MSNAPSFLSIIPANAIAIEDFLRSVNGRAWQHTLTSFSALAEIAASAERALTIDGVSPLGAVVWHTSGGKVAQAYKYSRILTQTTIARSTTGWVLVDASRVSAERATKYALHATLFNAAAALPWATRRNVVALPDHLVDVVAGLMTLVARLTCPDPRIRAAAICSVQTDVPEGAMVACESATASERP